MGTHHSSSSQQPKPSSQNLSIRQKHKDFWNVSTLSSAVKASKRQSHQWWSELQSDQEDWLARRRRSYTTIFILKPSRQFFGNKSPFSASPPLQPRHNKVAAAASAISQELSPSVSKEPEVDSVRQQFEAGSEQQETVVKPAGSIPNSIDTTENGNRDKTEPNVEREILHAEDHNGNKQESLGISKPKVESTNIEAAGKNVIEVAATPQPDPQETVLTDELLIRQQKNALFDHLLKSLSSFPTPSIARSPVAAMRRQNSEDNGSKYSQNRQFHLRVASALSPKHLMTSPFRGLRRAASTSASSINCCGVAAPPSIVPLVSSGGSAFSYPYPRSHTTLMLLPSSSNTPRGSTVLLATQSRSGSAGSSRFGSRDWSSQAGSQAYNQEDDAVDIDNNNIVLNYPNAPVSALDTVNGNNDTSDTLPYNFIPRRPRPPLNRAIPPIPESKSNESIMSAQSTSLSAANTTRRQSNIKNNNLGDQSNTNTDETTDKSVVIENRMAQSLTGRPSTSKTIEKQPTIPEASSRLPQPRLKSSPRTPDDPTKSPLLSMAHSVRHRLAKFGNKFGKNKPGSEVRTSTSLTTMKRDPSQGELAAGSSRIPKLGVKKSTKLGTMLKSSSMEEGGAAAERKKRIREDKQVMHTTTPAPTAYGWYTSGDSGVPRRLPVTTLIPISPSGGVGGSSFGTKRLPPEDIPPPLPVVPPPEEPVPEPPIKSDVEDDKKEDSPLENEKEPISTITQRQVQFQDIDSTCSEVSSVNQQPFRAPVTTPSILARNQEIEHVDLSDIFEPRPDPPTPKTTHTIAKITILQQTPPSVHSSKMMASTEKIDDLELIDSEVKIDQEARKYGCDLWEIPKPGTLRKTPQSFPPMPVSLKSQRRPASLKGAMSVSFAAADDEMKSRAKESGKESPASRGIFSTRSLRMAAARLAEASPRLRRRAKTQVSVDEKQEKSPKNKGESTQRKVIITDSRPNRRGNFQKSASIPSEKSYLERKAKKSTEKKSLATTSTLSLGTSPDDMKLIKKLENSFEVAAKKFDLRSVKSIHAKKSRKAPLAEFESSKVAENSPAVELPPVDFLRQLNSSPGQQRRRYFASLTTSGVESKSVESPVKPTAPSRLAELLASPPPPPPQHRQRQPVLVLDGIEAEPLPRLSLDGVNAASATLKTQDRLDSHRSGLIDDEIIDQPMLISTSDIALIDDITTTLSVCSAASEEKKAESTKVIASLPTCLLRYCLEDEDDRASSATNDSFLQSVGVNTAAKPHISQIPRRKSKLPTPSPSLSSVAEMDKEVGTTAMNQTTQVKKSAVGGRMSVPEQKISKMRITERTSVANTTRPRSQQKDGTLPTTIKKNGAAVTPTSQKPFHASAVASTSTPETRTNGHGSDDSPPFPLPEMITEFKGELYQLHDAMQKDYEEMERLRHENESLRHQLAERDQMIQKLQQQVHVSDTKK